MVQQEDSYTHMVGVIVNIDDINGRKTRNSAPTCIYK